MAVDAAVQDGGIHAAGGVDHIVRGEVVERAIQGWCGRLSIRAGLRLRQWRWAPSRLHTIVRTATRTERTDLGGLFCTLRGGLLLRHAIVRSGVR